MDKFSKLRSFYGFDLSIRQIGTVAALKVLKVQIYGHISGHTIVSAAATDEGFARFQLNAEREFRSFKQSDNEKKQ